MASRPYGRGPAVASRKVRACFRVVVHDAQGGQPGYRGMGAFAVAAMLSRIGIDSEWVDAGEPAEVLARMADPAPSCAVLVLSAAGRRRDPDAAVARMWERPAALTRGYLEAGLEVVAVRLGGSTAALAACIEAGATPVASLEDLPRELCRLAGGLSAGWSWPERDRPAAEPGLADGFGDDDRAAQLAALRRLTGAERRVLALLASGWSAQEIAEQSVLSLNTVRSHIRSILRELGVSSQLAAVAIVNGAAPFAPRSEASATASQHRGSRSQA
ncbi:MAG TPA: LuxR C-terminal-related transcriptional regulator [Acidimicrobiales bacterium]|nr:LuxR C-terminal-related transcriptional regulator [Acidimicrobiales bacterium]